MFLTEVEKHRTLFWCFADCAS